MFKPMSRTLAMVRETFDTYLANAGSAVIYAKTDASDGAGGVTTTWTATGTVAAWLMPMAATSQIEVAGGATGERQLYNLACGTATALALGSRVVYSGTTYEVTNLSHTTGIEWTAFQKAVVAVVV